MDFDGTEIKASLFADDATCTLKDVVSVIRLFELCEQYSKYSGLRLNVSKSLLVFIGPWKVKPNIPKYEVQIESDSFNILGIFLGQDRTKCNERNFNNKIHKMKQKLNMWSQRGLSLIGKVLISKSMGISNLIYSLSCVVSSKGDLNKAQQIVNDFIWKQKPAKIKHNVLIGPYERSGIRAPDLIIMQKSLRLAWLSRIWNEKSCNKPFRMQLKKYGGIKLLMHSNYNPTILQLTPFYKELFMFFKDLHRGSEFTGILWNNKELCINKQTIFKDDWCRNGVLYIRDLLDSTYTMLSRQELRNKYNISVDPLYYNSLKCIVHNWLKNENNYKYLDPNYKVNLDSSVFRLNDCFIDIQKAKSRDYYDILIEKKFEPPTNVHYWQNVRISKDVVLSSIETIKKCTKETYLIALQVKIVHNILATNKKMSDWSIKHSSKCDFCAGCDTVLHHMWECHHTRNIINFICRNLKSDDFKNNLTQPGFLFGTGDLRVDNMFLIIKSYIYIYHAQG